MLNPKPYQSKGMNERSTGASSARRRAAALSRRGAATERGRRAAKGAPAGLAVPPAIPARRLRLAAAAGPRALRLGQGRPQLRQRAAAALRGAGRVPRVGDGGGGRHGSAAARLVPLRSGSGKGSKQEGSKPQGAQWAKFRPGEPKKQASFGPEAPTFG